MKSAVFLTSREYWKSLYQMVQSAQCGAGALTLQGQVGKPAGELSHSYFQEKKLA